MGYFWIIITNVETIPSPSPHPDPVWLGLVDGHMEQDEPHNNGKLTPDLLLDKRPYK